MAGPRPAKAVSTVVEPVDLLTADDETLRAVHDLLVISEAEELPGDPPEPFAERAAHFRMPRMGRKKLAWIAHLQGRRVGFAEIRMGTVDNLDNAQMLFFLHPEARGLGLARMLARPVVEALRAEGRTRLIVDIVEGMPAEKLARDLGFELAMRETRSRLVLADIDRDLMRLWIDRAPERAADYELLFFPDRVPDAMLKAYARLMEVMNTAPREGLHEEDSSFTPEQIREIEDNFARVGAFLPSMVARHRPTGELAGFTNISYSPLNPSQGWQWGTGVDPGHRNKGLGRWLKAAMIEEVIASFPEMERLDTYNAGSNAAMLNINIAMGFKPLHNRHAYQGPVSSFAAWVEKGRL